LARQRRCGDRRFAASAGQGVAAIQPPFRGNGYMTGPAQETVVLEAALPAAVGDRHDVIGFPSRPCGAPGFPRRAVAGGRFRARPLAVGLDDVEAAQLAGALVAFLDLLAHVPRAAANLPLVDASIAAERPPGRFHRGLAPAADWLARVIAFRHAPQIGGHHARATSAHA